METSKTPIQFGGVKFVNFPIFTKDETTSGYPMLSCGVAEKLAALIPEDMREAVTVDWEKLDTDELIQVLKGELGVESPFSSREEALAAERRLIDILREQGAFPDTEE